MSGPGRLSGPFLWGCTAANRWSDEMAVALNLAVLPHLQKSDDVYKIAWINESRSGVGPGAY